MTLLEYQKLAKRTCPDLGTMNLNTLHMTVGVVTEIGEIVSCLSSEEIDMVNLGEELADIMWYTVNYATFHNLDITKLAFLKKAVLQDNLVGLDSLILYSTTLLDYDKKWLAYKKIPKIEDIEHGFKLMFNAISDMFLIYNLDPYKAMENNIRKLQVRYPEKFSEESAINRDLDQERVELEK